MELIIAIAIGLFLLFCLASGQVSHAAAERSYKQSYEDYERRKNSWISRVTNRAIEDSITERFEKNDTALMQELKETEAHYKGRGPISKKDCIRMLMANRHLLCSRDALFGIDVKLGYGDNADAYYDNQIYFAWWINQKLIEGGVNENMYIYSCALHYPFGYVDYRPGQVIWEPMTFMSSIAYSKLRLEEIGFFRNAVKREFHM